MENESKRSNLDCIKNKFIARASKIHRIQDEDEPEYQQSSYRTIANIQ